MALAARGLVKSMAQALPSIRIETYHAVAREEGEGEPGTILEVYQKGYRVKDKTAVTSDGQGFKLIREFGG